MKRDFAIGLTIFLLTIISLITFAQTKSQDKPLTEQINWLDFFVVTISHNAEHFYRKEINVIYHQDSIVKIHSVLKSNSTSDMQIDTVFALNGQQLSKLDKFWTDFKNKSIPTGIVIAGTKTTFTATLNGLTTTLENKSDYSLIMDLLKK